MECYVGIDPGKKGAYAVIRGKEVYVFPWDDEAFVRSMGALKDDGDDVTACVEKVGAMPGQGVTSMFSFGKSAGFIEGVLSAFGFSYQLVPPQKWKKEYSLGSDKTDSVTVCKHLFPGISLLPTARCRKDSDGMAEAVLMAEYARRKL